MRNSEPIGIRPILFRRSDASEIGCPFTLVMTSPALIPAFSAGESAMTSLTTAPISILSPKVVAKSGVNVPSDRPIGCWSSWAATARVVEIQTVRRPLHALRLFSRADRATPPTTEASPSKANRFGPRGKPWSADHDRGWDRSFEERYRNLRRYSAGVMRRPNITTAQAT